MDLTEKEWDNVHAWADFNPAIFYLGVIAGIFFFFVGLQQSLWICFGGVIDVLFGLACILAIRKAKTMVDKH